jgi:hypothetical protein
VSAFRTHFPGPPQPEPDRFSRNSGVAQRGRDSRSVAPRGPERIADFRLKCSNQVASRRIRRPSAFITLIGTSKENE